MEIMQRDDAVLVKPFIGGVAAVEGGGLVVLCLHDFSLIRVNSIVLWSY